jgi:hypothetical protein
VLTEGARKIYHGRHGARGRRVGQGWSKLTETKSNYLCHGSTWTIGSYSGSEDIFVVMGLERPSESSSNLIIRHSFGSVHSTSRPRNICKNQFYLYFSHFHYNIPCNISQTWFSKTIFAFVCCFFLHVACSPRIQILNITALAILDEVLRIKKFAVSVSVHFQRSLPFCNL